jgi:hypothetical protein
VDPERTLAPCLATVAVAVAVWNYVARVVPYEAVDLEGYLGAARAFARGAIPPPSQAIHSPFLVLLAGPLAQLPLPLATAIWRTLSAGAYAATIALLWWLYRGKLTSLEGAIALLGAAALPGVFSSLRYGQVNLIVGFLIVFALACLGRSQVTLGGLALGISIALKPVALLLIPGFVVLGRIRCAAAAALALAAVFTGSSLLLYSPLGAGQWFRTGFPVFLGGTSGWGQSHFAAGNQSLPGLLVKFSTPRGATALYGLALTAGVAIGLGMLVLLRLRGRTAPPDGEDLLLQAGFLITGTLLASPLTWPYYSSLLPLPLVATYLALRPCGSRRLAVAFGIAAYFLVGHDLWHDVWPPPRVPVPLPPPMILLTQSAQFIGILALFVLQAGLLWGTRTDRRRET